MGRPANQIQNVQEIIVPVFVPKAMQHTLQQIEDAVRAGVRRGIEDAQGKVRILNVQKETFAVRFER